MLNRSLILVCVLPLLAPAAECAPAPRAKPAKRRAKPVVRLPGKLILQENFENGINQWQCRGNGELKWVQDAQRAHQGAGCLMGKVVGDRKANFFERELDFSASSIYRFVIWARSDKVGKLVLWSQQGKLRRMLGAWQYVGRRWRRYECQFSVPEGGRWFLQVIVPSSHAAPECTMWVDDLKLFGTEVPACVNLTQEAGYSTEPCLAVDASGAVWMSWLSFGDGHDTLMVARVDRAGQDFSLGQKWPVALPKANGLLGSALVAGGKEVWLAFAGEVDKNWDIYVCQVGPDGPARPKRVTRDQGVDAKPAAAFLRGRLWTAWESNRDGSRQVYVSPVESPRPTRVSQVGINSYCPAIASHGNALWVAWHAYANANYDLYGRRVAADREPGAVQRLTYDSNVDRHAQLASCANGLWIAWQREIMGKKGAERMTRNYRTGIVAQKQSRLCLWSAQGLRSPVGLDKTILSKGTEQPTLAVDAQNRIWVTARRARGQHTGWDSVLQCYGGSEWGEPQQLSTKVGWEGRGAIAPTQDRTLVAYQVGRTPAFKTVEESRKAASDICLTAVPLSSAPRADAPKLEKLAEDRDVHWAARLREQLGEESPHRTIEYQGKKLHLFWGGLHEHTSISICIRWKDLCPDDSHAHERDIIKADFIAFTDHGYNFCPALWNYMAKIVRVNHDPGRFVAFLGEEWTSSIERYSDEHPEGFYGHRNIIFADPYFPRWFNSKDETTPRQLWGELRSMKANFVTIPHQLADTGNVPTDWDFVDETAQPVAEIFQARQSYEYKGAPRQAPRTIDGYFIQDAWAKGIVIGVIASPDHGGGQGKAAVYATELTREAILDALRARRCYGTTAARIFLDVRVNGHLMGEKIRAEAGEPVVVAAKVIGANDLERVELCRNNEFIYTRPAQGRAAEFEYRDMAPRQGRSYYYVRVQQKDGELAWSSPVWVTRQ